MRRPLTFALRRTPCALKFPADEHFAPASPQGRTFDPPETLSVLIQRLKLRPPQVSPSWMSRSRLETSLGSASRVVSVVAGPGYGKTVLAAQHFSNWKGPKLWYSLDAADADLAVLAAHLHAGLRALDIGPPDFEASHVGSGSPVDTAMQFAESIAEAAAPVLLVFDDVHVLEKSRGLVALDELIKRGCQSAACFILCGRSMPVALGIQAAGGHLTTVTASDLTFDNDEVLAYLRVVVDKDPSGELVQLANRAEGWPAGLSLIASGARKVVGSRGNVEARSSSQTSLPVATNDEMRQYLFDYLASEVLSDLTPDERRFLLDSSILDVLEAELCDAITEGSGSRQLLASFVERGLFVARRSEDAFTYHQLFHEFLRDNLVRSRRTEEVAALHARAAGAYLQRGDSRQAIHHYLQAGDTEAAVHTLESAAPDMLRMGLISAVDAVLRRLDRERVLASPTLLLALGRVQRERGEWDNALQTLDQAIAAARERRQYDTLAEAVRTCAPILGSRGEFQRLRTMLGEALAPDSQLPEPSATSLRMTLAAVLLEADELEQSLALYRELTPLLVRRGDLAAHGLVLHNTGVAHLRRGDIYTGLSMYERALKLKEQTGQRISMLTTLGDLIYVRTLLGDVDEAERLVDTMLAQANEIGATHIITRALEQQGALKLLRREVDAAHDIFRRAQATADPADMILVPEIEHGLAKCALLKHNFPEADALCARANAHLGTLGRHQQRAPILTTRAEVLAATGDVAAACTVAGEAVTASGQGANALVQATTCLEAAALLAACAGRLQGPEAERADRQAAEAATTAVALIHQRDYRFLLHAKASVFERLRPHMRRWAIGAALLPELKTEPSRALRIEALGPLRVFVDGQEVPPEAWKRRRALEVFAYLLSQQGRAVPRARLIDLWWPESDADAAHDSLRVVISAIRKVVGDVIKYESNAYRFVAAGQTQIDVAHFDELIDAARQAEARGDLVLARKNYQAASQSYRGDFLEGMQEGGWQWHERERLRAACLEALRWIARDCAAAADLTGQRLAVERILEIAPFDLDAVRIRLDALVREMRVSEAREDYASWRARYKAAVGAEAPEFWQGPARPEPAPEPVPLLG